ncbi:DUF6629 family protein [Albimonas pacifica]|uniref:Uncharacterized protein n=1 Tax=Albimonas pacifica TaxID=1114924 RepID=A0A1I3E817_9RHOB|nr:DUF6629 family protein [Albimonas pacifica]SFH95120.1 hypothetical protein SAMN05216258_103234 [Albimonas pacifica]
MCFSATASFAAAAVLTGAGAVALRAALGARLGPGWTLFAAFPLVFGLQQALEGLVWLGVEGRLPPGLAPWTTAGFLFFALCFWPVAGPLAGRLMETEPRRAQLFSGLTVLGAALGVYLLGRALAGSAAPQVLDGRLAYLVGVDYPPGIEFVYLAVAASALLASSHREARLFWAALTASFALVAATWEVKTLPSVWCFFAALCSLLVVRGVLRRRGAAQAITRPRPSG